MSTGNALFEGTPAAHQALSALCHRLQERHQGAVKAVLFYGSCLRSGDLFDGLVDLYIIVDHYRSAHRSALAAAANRLLPPNVYYCEATVCGATVRCKYAVLSLDQFEAGCSGRWFQSYIWGRFCQPVAIAWTDNAETTDRVQAAFLQAASTFLNRTLSLNGPAGTVRGVWETGLAACYRTELRAEGGKRPGLIVEQGAAHYIAITRAVASALSPAIEVSSDPHDPGYRILGVQRSVTATRIQWRVRQLQGKFLSIARLLKALFTFDGGLDYIAWKLERHSGQPVEIPAHVRRWPLIFIWSLMWRLYRRGVFR